MRWGCSPAWPTATRLVEPGRVCWVELRSPRRSAARRNSLSCVGLRCGELSGGGVRGAAPGARPPHAALLCVALAGVYRLAHCPPSVRGRCARCVGSCSSSQCRLRAPRTGDMPLSRHSYRPATVRSTAASPSTIAPRLQPTQSRPPRSMYPRGVVRRAFRRRVSSYAPVARRLRLPPPHAAQCSPLRLLAARSSCARVAPKSSGASSASFRRYARAACALALVGETLSAISPPRVVAWPPAGEVYLPFCGSGPPGEPYAAS